MRTDALIKLLKARYNANSYAFFTNVADGTGSNVSRWADGLAVSLWPSRGLTLEGFELKVSRSDWLRELENPAKAEAVCKYCDHWWLVVSDAAIVKDGELPDTWGLIASNAAEDGLVAKVKAPRLSPVPLDRHIVAAIARRACEQSADVEALKAARQEGVEDGRLARESELRDLRLLRDRVNAFTKATGIGLSEQDYLSRFRWAKPEEIGAAVLLAMDGGETFEEEKRRMREAAHRVLEIVGDKTPEVTTTRRKRRA